MVVELLVLVRVIGCIFEAVFRPRFQSAEDNVPLNHHTPPVIGRSGCEEGTSLEGVVIKPAVNVPPKVLIRL